MRFSRLIIVTALVSLGAVGALFAFQDPKEMAQAMALVAPNENHKVLEYKVGKWTGHMSLFMIPGAPPMESDLNSEVKWIMGGRFLHDTTGGTFMGQPFEGMGTSGYDNLKKKYVFTWIDNNSTSIMSGEGTWDAAKKTLTCKTSMPDPMSGKEMPARMVETVVDADHWKMEMNVTGPDGKEALAFRIEYKRAK